MGVTGHRPDRIRDEEAVREGIHEVLRIVQQTAQTIHDADPTAYAPGGPRLRVVSPLAEGADRLAVREALQMGFELECPLPFSIREYKHDFHTHGSRAEFDELLDCAVRVLELDGVPAHRAAAYEAAGRMVLRHCDLLIAVWDGDQRRGVGGTAQIVQEAALLEIPVAWIHSAGAQEPVLLLPDGSREPLDKLAGHLEILFQLPADNEMDDLRSYLHDRPTGAWLGLPYRWFRTAMLTGRRPPKSLPEPEPPFATPAVQAHFQRAEALATVYAGMYRSSFLLIYALAAFSVAAAAAAANHALGWVSAVELLLIFSTMGIALWGARRGWHQRWSDYRLLTEHLRHAQFLRPLGRVASSFRVPAHVSPDDPGRSWVHWLFRALVREAGLMEGQMDERVERERARFGALVAHQLSYHEGNEHTHHVLHRRLHTLGFILFGSTIVASMWHLAEYALPRMQAHGEAPAHEVRAAAAPHRGEQGAEEPHAVEPDAGEHTGFPWPSFLAIVLPAFGAALVGIESQGEFSRIARRSKGMAMRLESLGGRLAAARRQHPDQLTSGVVGEVAESAAEAMRAELMDWRLIFSEKPLRLPG